MLKDNEIGRYDIRTIQLEYLGLFFRYPDLLKNTNKCIWSYKRPLEKFVPVFKVIDLGVKDAQKCYFISKFVAFEHIQGYASRFDMIFVSL